MSAGKIDPSRLWTGIASAIVFVPAAIAAKRVRMTMMNTLAGSP